MNSFGSTLREWRNRRRFSQLDLSIEANISARHISFLEQGRANPSRDMVLLLGSTLGIPLAEVNNGLMAAGFASVYPNLTPDAESLRSLNRAIDVMIDNHSPWPAIACDGSWNLCRANETASYFIQLLGGSVEPDDRTNMMTLMLQCDDKDGPILNWPEVARLILARLRTERLAAPDNELLNHTIESLRTHPRIGESRNETMQQMDVVIPLQLAVDGRTLSMFSMIAQFGSVQELNMNDLRIELFFPQDDATTAFFNQLSNG